MKVAIYARVSTKTKGQDCENQLSALREYSARMGYTVYREFVDQESGTTANRIAFTEMFAAAARRKFDLLLFWSLDRFSREGVRKTIFLLQQLDDYGVSYKSYNEQFIDSSGIFKDVIISLLATLANQEQVRLSERVKAGLERAKSHGRVGGRPTITVEQVQKIMELKNRDFSVRQIARELDIHHKTVSTYLARCTSIGSN